MEFIEINFAICRKKEFEYTLLRLTILIAKISTTPPIDCMVGMGFLIFLANIALGYGT